MSRLIFDALSEEFKTDVSQFGTQHSYALGHIKDFAEAIAEYFYDDDLDYPLDISFMRNAFGYLSAKGGDVAAIIHDNGDVFGDFSVRYNSFDIMDGSCGVSIHLSTHEIDPNQLYKRGIDLFDRVKSSEIEPIFEQGPTQLAEVFLAIMKHSYMLALSKIIERSS